jgi:CelD/BcsL family acetyltransferase involved in cellulose biosynthesis
MTRPDEALESAAFGRLPPGAVDGARTAHSGVRIDVVAPRDLTDRHLAEWRSFQNLSPALESPYLCPEFTRLVDAVRPGVAVAVATAEEDGRTAGFFPFQRRGSVGKPVGGPISDCQAVLAASWWDFEPKALVRASGMSVQDFTYVRAEQRAFAPFHRTVDVSYAIDLSRGFDDYVRERKECGRQAPGDARFGLPHHALERARRLERQHGPVRFSMHDADPATLRLLLAWKSEQYRRTGSPDVFAKGWTLDLVKRIHAAQGATFAGVLSTLSVGGTVIAAHMGMRSASVLHWWFPTYNRTFSKFSPGLILLLEVCRHAADAGIRTVELGAGDEPYKLQVANGGIEVASAFVGSASLPFWYRRFRYAVEDLALRLPLGPVSSLPGKVFRRIEMAGQYR